MASIWFLPTPPQTKVDLFPFTDPPPTKTPSGGHFPFKFFVVVVINFGAYQELFFSDLNCHFPSTETRFLGEQRELGSQTEFSNHHFFLYDLEAFAERGQCKGCSCVGAGSVDRGPAPGMARLLQISLERDGVVEGPQFTLSSPLALCLDSSKPSSGIASLPSPCKLILSFLFFFLLRAAKWLSSLGMPSKKKPFATRRPPALHHGHKV